MTTNLYSCANNYNKTLARLENNLQSGRFASYTRHKKTQLWNRLCRYARQLGISIKTSVAAACLAAGLCISATAAAQTFTHQTGAANPFDGVVIGNNSTPSFADIDGDGDRDAFIGEQDGNINYFQNTGTALAAFYTYQTGPLNSVDIGSNSSQGFADIDGDGDLDAFIGENDGIINYYRNTGTALAPVFALRTGAANPFNGVDIGNHSAPIFADIDRDGDMDAFIGKSDGTISYYQNTGTARVPVFAEQTGAVNPFNGVDIGDRSTPAFADIDDDGDMDAIIGEQDGTINYYKNTGTALAPVFAEQTGAANPFDGMDVGDYSAPAFEDTDGDGDMDAFVGEFWGTVIYFENTTPAAPQPTFVEQTGTANPFNGVSIGTYSSPAFVDIDGDGDLDVFIGEIDGIINYYRNTGTALSPVFTEQTGAANPFNGVDIGDYSTPAFADIDGDGDMDAFIGNKDGGVNYYRNTGTALVPVFTEQTGGANPFDGVNIGGYSAPAFADIDADGDIDAFIGGNTGFVVYYENTGTPLVPQFTLQTDTEDPFDGVDVGQYSTPAFDDIDGDGDMDAFIGEFNGTINYYQNTGTALAPVFAELTGTANPLNNVNTGTGGANPAFADLDGDGDIDAFIGQQNGGISYFENTTNITLPLQLLSFSGSKQAGYNHLQWQTAGEVNTKWFEIERSSDERSFIKIATVNTTGNSNNNYGINDNVIYSGKIYYRLKMVDTDGRFTYSNTIWLSSDADAGITIYPNPVKDVISINMGNAAIVKITARIYDVNGRLMQNILISNNQQQVNVRSLATGVYTIKFADGSVQRFIKE